MEVSEIIQAVSTVGFPVVAATAMFFMVKKMNEQYLSFTEKWSAIVQENTDAIRELKEMMER